jgi:hypothetical protein
VAEAERERRPSLAEALWVWTAYGLVAVVIVVTYARLSPDELYNTDESGLTGGLGRALVFLNFSTALVVPGVAAIVAARARSRVVDVLALAAVLLAAVTVVPGVVDQGDLDAKPVNAVPALGVALALGLTVWTAVRHGIGPLARRVRYDGLRLVLGVVLVLASVPWIAAELGFYAGLGGVFMAGEVVPEPGHPDIRAVHLGHHHGLDGALLALSALALTRELGSVARRRLKLALAGYLSLMLVYGLANALQDFWLEQLVKRGTTTAKLPDVLRPELSPEWLGIVLAAVAVYAFLAHPAVARPRT